jgi:hypothetical protein
MSQLATGSGTMAAPLSMRGNDLYETPPEAVRALLAVESVPSVVWEPACGPGAIVRELRQLGRLVHASDLVDYQCPGAASRRDFLMERHAPCSCIVTNPPFKLAEEFAQHALDLCDDVYLLLRLAFLEGLRWQERGLARHLAAVHVFAPRLPFMHRSGWDGPVNSNSGMPFAWFVWRKSHVGRPTVGWLNWREMEAAA